MEVTSPVNRIHELNKYYETAELCDKSIFAEQRSNILLMSGEHYSKKAEKYFNRWRDSKYETSEKQKLRLTKNHIHRVVKLYVGNILTHSPGVTIVPQKDSDMQDQKAADLNKSVWEDAKYQHRLKEKTRKWCNDFIGIGEVAVKIFFDPTKGKVIGYEPSQDEEGNSQYDDNGEEIPNMDNPVFSGDFVFERVFGFNLLRPSHAKAMEDAEYLIIRKMVDVSQMMRWYSQDSDKLKMIHKSLEDEFVVFDESKSSYDRSKNQMLIREFYFKPCQKYPEGYFYICAQTEF